MDPPSSDQSTRSVDGSLPTAREAATGVVRTLLAGWLTTRTWRATVNLLLWWLTCVGALVGTLGGLALSAITAWVPGLRVAVRASVARLLAGLANADRRRIETCFGVRLEPFTLPRLEPGASMRARQRSWAEPSLLWRVPGYELICAPVVTALVVGAAAWWCVTAACAIRLAHAADPLSGQWVTVLGLRFWPSPGAAVVLGVAGVLLWPTAVRLVSLLDLGLANLLLGPSPAELTREVERLSETRAQAVSAADAERRRIERDLHDGFQPQLVNLALNLGLVRSRLSEDPEAARELLDRAHADAKQASAELRNLVRGIHPSVLDERGLDAAFSALAARSSVPLRIDVHLDRRPPPEVEGIAYFLVAEALTNVSKHARARSATVTVSETGDALWVLVQDDGRGGARTDPGGGLAGLASRIAAVDGTFSVMSPEGGPTWIEATIPCEW